MKLQRLPDPGQVVAGVRDLGIRSHPGAEEDGVGLCGDRGQLVRVDVRAEPELDADACQRLRLFRQRLPHLTVRSDRVADEAADFLALVEDRHVVAERSQLAGADEPGRAGADHGNVPSVPRRGLPERRSGGERLVGGVALE